MQGYRAEPVGQLDCRVERVCTNGAAPRARWWPPTARPLPVRDSRPVSFTGTGGRGRCERGQRWRPGWCYDFSAYLHHKSMTALQLRGRSPASAMVCATVSGSLC